MRPLRIALAVRDAGSLSGVSVLTRELAAGAARAGHEIFFLSRRPPRGLDARVRPVPVGWIPFTSLSRAWSFDLAARRKARRLGAALLHGHGDLTVQDVLSVHNVDPAEARASGREDVGSPGTLYVRSRQFRPGAARRIVTVSERARGGLERFYGVEPSRVRVIRPGVDSRRFAPEGREADRARLLGELGLAPGSRLTLALLSGDARRRNIDGIVRAFGRARLAPEEVLLVVGDPESAGAPGARELLARGRLKLRPRTPQPEALYRACDRFVLASHYETFGLTALEAAASGLPLIVTAQCGVSEVLRDGEDALILPDSRDDGALAAALERLSGRELSSRLAEGALRRARELSWEDFVRRHLELYEEIAIVSPAG